LYEVTGFPPLDDGAVHVNVTRPLPGLAETSVGAPGTLAGVAFTGLEAGPEPAELVALTLNE
jgi:hypothetical protein